MKIIQYEGKQLVAYVKNRDVEILLSMKEFISPNFFKEDSIVNRNVTLNGYYKIKDQDNIKYLKSLKFVADYDTLFDMDILSLSSLEGDLSLALQKLIMLFDSDDELLLDDIAYISSISCIDTSLISVIYGDSSQAKKQAAKLALKQQVRCYNYSVREMIYNKKKLEEEKREEEEENKKFTFKKAFQKIKGKLKI